MKKTGTSTNVLKSRRDSIAASLSGGKPFIEGSLKQIRVKCGNPKCKCATGEKHTSHILTRKVDGKTKSVYVPIAMVKEVSEWTEEYRKIKEKIRKITVINEQIIKQHVQVKRAVAKNLKLLKEQQQT
jgi:hypothetical protein